MPDRPARADTRDDGGGARQARLEPGAIVGHFSVLRPLGEGGMGEVFLARDVKLGRRVALKLIGGARATDPAMLERFLLEARATARFSHPNIVTIYEVGEHQGVPFLALEYLEGDSLRERVEQGRLGLREAIRIGKAVADAVAEAHRHGILHRDLKPENVLLARDGRPRVLDFGLALFAAAAHGDERAAPLGDEDLPVRSHPPEAEAVTASDETAADARAAKGASELAGTPAYMAPEQWAGSGAGTGSDVWALGLMLYEMARGEHPFAGLSTARLIARVCGPEPVPSLGGAPEASSGLAALVARCLDKSASARPSAAEVATELGELLLKGSPTARPAERRPFRGLLAFEEAHAELFFGREAETAALVERLRREPLVAVVGPSGAGKSSFVQAGVVPRLREQGPWTLVALRPGRRPLESLAVALLDAELGRSSSEALDRPSLRGGAQATGAADAARVAARAGELRADPAGLARALRALAARRATSLLLVVDQLEEAYALVSDVQERQAFLVAIATAADDPREPVRGLFTLRDDFLGRLASVAEMRDALSHVVVLRAPGRDVLEDVITKPLAALGVGYDDPTLPKRMIDEVGGEPAALPLLEFAADLLWDRRDEARGLVRTATYEAMGGVAGALASHADAVVDGLGSERASVARELLLRLVTADRTRRLVGEAELLEGLGDAGEAVLGKLGQARLVTVRRGKAGGEAAGPEVELAHESLIVSWARFARWIDESRDDLAFVAEARAAAERWLRRGKRNEELWRGLALVEASVAARRMGERLPGAVQEFLAACRAREKRNSRVRAFSLGAVVALLSAAVVVSVRVAVTLREREQAAVEAKDASVEREAMAELSAARSAHARGQMLEARTRLRRALELRDSKAGRSLWAELRRAPELLRLELGTALFGAAYFPDGQTVATAGSDGLVYLVDSATGQHRVLRGPGEGISVVIVAANGSLIVAGTENGAVCWWKGEAASRVCSRIERPLGHFFSLAASARGEALFGIAKDPGRGRRSLVRIEVATGQQMVRAITGAPTKLESGLAVSGDGALVAVAGAPSVQLFRAPDLEPLRPLPPHDSEVLAVAFHPTEPQLVAQSHDSLRLVDVRSGRELARAAPPEIYHPGLTFSTSGALLALPLRAGGAQVRALDRLALVGSYVAHSTMVSGLAFDPIGEIVASAGSYDNELVLRRWRKRSDDAALPATAGVRQTGAFDFSPDSQWLSVLSKEDSSATTGREKVRTLDVASGRLVREAKAPGGGDIWYLRYARAGSALAIGALNGPLSLSDAASGQTNHTRPGPYRSVAVGPTGKYAVGLTATRGVPPRLELVDVESGAVTAAIDVRAERASGVALSHDGSTVAVAQDKRIVLYDVAPLRERDRIELAAHGEGIDWSADDRQLAWTEGNAVRVYSLETRAARAFDLPFSPVMTWLPAFHPDGRRVAISGSTGHARIIDVESGRFVELIGHAADADVNQIEFSPDGRLVATSSDDGTLRTWHPDDGRPYWWAPLFDRASRRLHTHRGWVEPERRGAEPVGYEKRWERAVADEARMASVVGSHLCIATHRGALALWDRARDVSLATVDLAGLTRVAAVSGGCLTLNAGDARFHPLAAGSEARLLASKVTAIGYADETILVAGPDAIVGFGASGEQLFRLGGHEGVSAVSLAGGTLLLGHDNGTVEGVSRESGAALGAAFEGLFGSAVLSIEPGPHGLLAAGHANGLVLLWDAGTGELLERQHLHGAAIHLAFLGEKLNAATDLEDHVVLDLGVYGRAYCDLMAEIWREQLAVWLAGQPVRRGAPADHRCAP